MKRPSIYYSIKDIWCLQQNDVLSTALNVDDDDGNVLHVCVVFIRFSNVYEVSFFLVVVLMCVSFFLLFPSVTPFLPCRSVPFLQSLYLF